MATFQHNELSVVALLDIQINKLPNLYTKTLNYSQHSFPFTGHQTKRRRRTTVVVVAFMRR
jgi:hypothetical protein